MKFKNMCYYRKYVFVWGGRGAAHGRTGDREAQKGAPDRPELELEVVASHLKWALGTEPPSGKGRRCSQPLSHDSDSPKALF